MLSKILPLLEIVYFSLTLSFFSYNLYFVYQIQDPKFNQDSSLSFYKAIYYILAFIHFICIIKVSRSDPGVIDFDNNLAYVNFYLNIREHSMEEATVKMKSNAHMRQALFPNPLSEPYLDEDSEEHVDPDRYEYSSISEEDVEKLNKQYKNAFRRCYSCCAVKETNSHHCFSCGAFFSNQMHLF